MIRTCKTLEPDNELINAVCNNQLYRDQAYVVAKNIVNHAYDILTFGEALNTNEALEIAMRDADNWTGYEYLK